MTKKQKDVFIRCDGRTKDELRQPYIIKVGVIPKANGSAMVQSGKTIVIAGVYGPRKVIPKHLEDQEKAILRVRYNMITFSVPDRKKPGRDKRSMEISKIIEHALRRVIFLEDYPRTVIDVYLEVIQADAGTRVAALTAASVALADAGIHIRDLLPSVAVGRVNGNIVLDLNKEEEDVEDAVDLPFAYLPSTGEVLLLQMDGIAEVEEIEEMIDLAKEGCMRIYEIQKKALKEKYEKYLIEE